jgi:hypothetical protein
MSKLSSRFSDLVAQNLIHLKVKNKFSIKNVLHLGSNTIEDWNVLSDLFTGMNIASRPDTVEQIYELIGISAVVIESVNEFLDYETDEKFDLVVNCSQSNRTLRQYEFFEKIHECCNLEKYMLHIWSWFGSVDENFLNYQPNLFSFLAGNNNYGCVQFNIGTQHTEGSIEESFLLSQLQPSESGLYYISEYHPEQYSRPTWMSLILQKSNEDNPFCYEDIVQ